MTAERDAVVAELLNLAGIAGSWEIQPMAGGWVNEHLMVVADGCRSVVRRYRWPFPGEPPFDRAAKERWLLPRLADAGVRVPRVLAATDDALLLEHLDGVVLGTVVPRVPVGDLTPAWREAGESLRAAHDAMTFDEAGIVVEGGVRAFDEGSWGEWHVENTRRHGERIAARDPALAPQIDEAVHLVDGARPLLDARPLRLLHNDAHPWNALVDGPAPQWSFSAWLDWEFAWAGDPQYDLMKNTLQRVDDIGPTPDALYDGYGGRPEEPWFSIYRLGFFLWMGNYSVEKAEPNKVSYRDAAAYLADLPSRLEHLRQVLA